EAARLQRIAKVQSGERRTPVQQLAERPGEAGSLPAADRDVADAPDMKLVHRDASAEQADFDGLDARRTVTLDPGLDLTGRIFFRARHGRHAETRDRDDGADRDGGFPHGSASGCLACGAASNAGFL